MRTVILLLCSLFPLACVKPPVQSPLHSVLHQPDLNVTPRIEPAYPEVETRELSPFQVATPPLQSAVPTVLVNLNVQDAPVKEVLLALARDSGLNIDVHPALQGKVTMHAVQQSLPAILARLAKQVDMDYVWSNGVWTITPDIPVIRSYSLSFVNMSRDTTGYIGVASEINSAGRGATTTLAGGAGMSGMAVAAASNSSRTAVSSQSRYHLWETVLENLQALLDETDKARIARDEVLQAAMPAPPITSAVANPPVLDAPPPTLLATPNAPAPALASAQERTDKEGMAVKQAHSRWQAARMIASPETGIVTIRATQRQHAQVQAYLESVMQVASRQVLIEATIVEVELSNSYQMGIDWSRLSAGAQQRGWQFAQSLGVDAAQFNRSQNTWETNNSKNALGQNNGTVAFMLGYFNPFSRLGNLSASVTLLEQFGKARVLSSPKLMVLNNQTAILKVVDNLVYFTIQSQISQSTSTNGGNLQAVTTTANTVPVGLVMAVTAQVNSHARVSLNVRPTVSKVLRFIEDPNPQLGQGNNRIVSSIPEIQVREMESVLNIPSGNVAVLGGLMQEEQRNLTDKVPGLSRLPLVGPVFTGKNQAARKTELIVFLRPTVIGRADVIDGDLKAFKPLYPEGLATEPPSTLPADRADRPTEHSFRPESVPQSVSPPSEPLRLPQRPSVCPTANAHPSYGCSATYAHAVWLNAPPAFELQPQAQSVEVAQAAHNLPMAAHIRGVQQP